MSETTKLRGEFLREALLAGWYHPSHAPVDWNPLVSSDRIERWYDRLYNPAQEPLLPGARLVNHFMLGADPEIKFLTSGIGGQAFDAKRFHMYAGPAFGADNNGRLAEFRPEPSRSALSVVASTWLAMRWMHITYPECGTFTWRSGAYSEGDGLGGHIHFGRKLTRLRDREVAALDRILHLCYQAEIYDSSEARVRFNQAQGGHYGGPSDTRPQPHGWEYRSQPSWLDNPWLAFFSITVAKCVVAMAELVPSLCKADGNLSGEQARGQLRMLLAYFAPLDDDARLAFAILERRGFPKHLGGMDIKSSWGLFVNGPMAQAPQAPIPQVLPKTIPPARADLEELAASMYEGRSPDLTPLIPTWKPTTLPAGYYQLSAGQINTVQAPGLGEFLVDLAGHANQELVCTNMGSGRCMFTLPRLMKPMDKFIGLEKLLKEKYQVFVNWEDCFAIRATKDQSLQELLKIREVVVRSGLLPIWFLDEVRPDSYEKWANQEFKAKQSASKTILDTFTR